MRVFKSRMHTSTRLASLLILCLAGAARCQDFHPPGGTILPTDIVPLPASEEGSKFGQGLKLKVLQTLPSKLYFSVLFETSLRDETNVYQYPLKRQLVNKFQAMPPITLQQQQANARALRNASVNDGVFRALPNITVGWAFTPRTRVYANYFVIRDSLFHNVALNSIIQSVGGGFQHDFPLTQKDTLQANLQFRELFQNNQVPVFDYLPTLTYSRAITPKTIGFVSALLQLRGRQFAVAPHREIDPFYQFGVVNQRGLYTFSAAATFLQNFRDLFGEAALLPINNYSWILDFEVAHSIVKQVPALQVFVRAEPIYNFHSKLTPGLSGVDFRIFGGLRFGFGKPALTDALTQIRNQLQEKEAEPPPPKPTAQLKRIPLVRTTLLDAPTVLAEPDSAMHLDALNAINEAREDLTTSLELPATNNIVALMQLHAPDSLNR